MQNKWWVGAGVEKVLGAALLQWQQQTKCCAAANLSCMQFGHCARAEHTTVDERCMAAAHSEQFPVFVTFLSVVQQSRVTNKGATPPQALPPPTVGSLQPPAILPCALCPPRATISTAACR